jgi:hypothetical protein
MKDIENIEQEEVKVEKKKKISKPKVVAPKEYVIKKEDGLYMKEQNHSIRRWGNDILEAIVFNEEQAKFILAKHPNWEQEEV